MELGEAVPSMKTSWSLRLMSTLLIPAGKVQSKKALVEEKEEYL
jgi:hypothetical protein